jgi:hypothetical protein
MPVPLKVFVDISGVPKSSMCIGAVSFNSYQVSKFEKKFIKKFPLHKNSRWKSVRLKSDELLKIIKFLHGNKIVMGCTKISSEDWRNYKMLYNKRGYYIEKIIGIHYLNLIRGITYPISMKDQKIDIVFCKESFMNIA